MRTTVRKDARWIRQEVNRVKHFRLQGNFAHDVFTITDLARFPCSFSHGISPDTTKVDNIPEELSGAGIINHFTNSRYFEHISPETL
jgi:hypothetical protein